MLCVGGCRYTSGASITHTCGQEVVITIVINGATTTLQFCQSDRNEGLDVLSCRQSCVFWLQREVKLCFLRIALYRANSGMVNWETK